MKKYELTDEVKKINCRILRRIRALKDFGDVKKGDLGGWVESEDNLSQEGDCWVFGNALVFGNACVYEDARVCDDAKVFGNARIANNAQVFGNALVFGNARVSENARVYGDAQIAGDANITKASDVFTVSPIGSRDDTTTFYKTEDNGIYVKCGCKNTDIDTWLKMVEETHGDNKHGKAYRLAAQIARSQILGEEEMKILIACEKSQRVCTEMRKLGHEAYSCDIQEPSGGTQSGI